MPQLNRGARNEAYFFMYVASAATKTIKQMDFFSSLMRRFFMGRGRSIGEMIALFTALLLWLAAASSNMV